MANEKDFTPLIHNKLLRSLLEQDYKFITFLEYLTLKKEEPAQDRKLIILRHDVEKFYGNALIMAKIQYELGIRGSYYFRMLPKHYQPSIIKQIADLGHEIGYHYDDLVQCKGNSEKAIQRFQTNLQTLRTIAPVQTICMDGSPLSKFDNKNLWRQEELEKGRAGELEKRQAGELASWRAGEKGLSDQAGYHYSDFGIIGEPYYDMDFNDFFYLTDTGRRWDGWKTSVRDKVAQQERWIEEGLVFHSTQDIIDAVERRAGELASWGLGEREEEGRAGEKEEGKGRVGELEKRRVGEKSQQPTANSKEPKAKYQEQRAESEEGNSEIEQASSSVLRTSNQRSPIFPNRVMFTFHPQRWNDKPYLWTKELLMQNLKNQVKRFLVKR